MTRIRKPGLAALLQEGSRAGTDRSLRLRGGLCVAQVALGMILLSAAALLASGFHRLMHRDLGFEPEGLLSFSLSLPGQEYSSARQIDFYHRLLASLLAAPAVASAAAAMPLPLTGDQMTVAFNIQDRPSDPSGRPRSNMAIVTPGYFRTIGTPVLRGRDFTGRDDAAAPPVLIVNQAFADRFFPGQNAIGKRIEPGAASGPEGPRMREIVGIVGNARQSLFKPEPDPVYYLPYKQMPWCCPSPLVRGASSSVPLQPEIRAAVASLDRQVPLFDVRTLEEMRQEGGAAPRFLTLLLSAFALVALFLTATGLYGLLAHDVVRRTREIGLRIALGATRGEVVAMVAGRAMRLTAAGIALGLAGAAAAAKIAASLLVGAVAAGLLIALACAVIAVTAVCASWLPSRRAASIDPMQALRAE
jgi:predicted permease